MSKTIRVSEPMYDYLNEVRYINDTDFEGALGILKDKVCWSRWCEQIKGFRKEEE